MTPLRQTTPTHVLYLSSLLFFVASGCGSICFNPGNACTDDADCCVSEKCGEDGFCVDDPCVITCNGALSGACMPNPASVYCGRVGGTLSLEGSEGICTLPDGTEREEWELFCDQCQDNGFCDNGG